MGSGANGRLAEVNRSAASLKSAAGRFAGSLAQTPLLDAVGRCFPPAQWLHRIARRRQFARITPFARRFQGVYDSFAEAIRSAPSGRPVGYDNSAAATFMQPSGDLLPGDYPALFW